VRRVLVRSPNWLGDAVMSLPVLHGLGELFPQAEISVLAVSRVAPLFLHHPGVARVITLPRGRQKWRRLWVLRNNFDLALALPNSLESALGLWLTATPVRAGYNADARGPFLTRAVSGREKLRGLHQVYYYWGVLRALGPLPPLTSPALYLDPGEEAWAAGLMAGASGHPGPRVGLAPGAAYGPAKRWPPERFASLASELYQETGAQIVLLGGPEDRPAAAQVKKELSLPVLDLVGHTDLRQALAVLGQLKVLVTNDSGLMHAAAAMGVPLVAIFGSTDPEATGPFTPRATVLRHSLPCSPCFKRTCPEDYPCLAAVTVAEAAAAARARLEEGL
jgi:heptosyltransferase-2